MMRDVTSAQVQRPEIISTPQAQRAEITAPAREQLERAETQVPVRLGLLQDLKYHHERLEQFVTACISAGELADVCLSVRSRLESAKQEEGTLEKPAYWQGQRERLALAAKRFAALALDKTVIRSEFENQIAGIEQSLEKAKREVVSFVHEVDSAKVSNAVAVTHLCMDDVLGATEPIAERCKALFERELREIRDTLVRIEERIKFLRDVASSESVAEDLDYQEKRARARQVMDDVRQQHDSPL